MHLEIYRCLEKEKYLTLEEKLRIIEYIIHLKNNDYYDTATTLTLIQKVLQK